VAISSEKSSADYLPLNIEYREKLQAGGKIKGSRWVKREGRPMDHEILLGRLIDRAVRPTINENIRNDIQVTVTPLSSDKENETEFPAFTSVILALKLAGLDIQLQSLSIIGVKSSPDVVDQMSYQDRKYEFGKAIDYSSINTRDPELVVHPTLQEKSELLGFLSVASFDRNIVMLEGESKEMPIGIARIVCEKALEANNEVLATLEKVLNEYQDKKTVELHLHEQDEFDQKIYTALIPSLQDIVAIPDHASRDVKIESLKEHLLEAGLLNEEEVQEFDPDPYYKKFIQKMLLEEGKRIGGRKMDEIRELEVNENILYRVHGSGYFRRGETEALTVATLGSPGDVQNYENMEAEGERRFFHFYNFPPYSTGEARPVRGVSRREIGHGALAEKAIRPMVPPKEIFPYTIQLVTEILTSNGSTSMASTCGSSIALMSTGVPIKNCVAGVAIGLMADDKDNPSQFKVLTDIQGEEDFYGYMDFKLTCTNNGMTALQMDTKLRGVPVDIINEAFEAGEKGALEIRDKILSVISRPEDTLSEYAPRIMTMNINPEKIKIVIGKGGETIQKIIAETGVGIDIEQDGQVFITSEDAEMAEKAMSMITELIYEPEVGDILDGKVVRVESFGAIVKCGSFDGLLHVSKVLPSKFIKDINEFIKVGDTVRVKVSEIDKEGRVRFERIET